jgi:hypothetical protein
MAGSFITTAFQDVTAKNPRSISTRFQGIGRFWLANFNFRQISGFAFFAPGCRGVFKAT